MTQRERHTPDGGAQALARCVAAGTTAHGSTEWWENLFPRIPTVRQQELLDLAGRQGLLYAHQVDARSAAPSVPHLLVPALVKGQSVNLDPLQPPNVDFFDCDLDDAQREAVARAVHTPDVCLIQGQPGTGKSRVVAEIIAQAAAHGERVLLLAPGAAAIDCVLERIGARESLCPVRCLAPDERPETLPACVRRLTFAERLCFFEEKTLGAARQAYQKAQQQCAARRRDEALWPRLEAALDRLLHLDAQCKALAERRDGLPAEVEAEASHPTPFQDGLAVVTTLRAETLSRIDSRLASVSAEGEKVRRATQRLESDLQPLLPLAEARRSGRWWTAVWWRAVFQGDMVGRVEQLQKQLQELLPTKTRLAKETDDLTAERARAAEQARRERDEAVRAETIRRRGVLEVRADALTLERGTAEAAWQAACRELTDAALIPTAPEREELRAKRAAWEGHLKQETERCEALAQWAAELEQARAMFPERLAQRVNVVAATQRGLANDAYFGDSVMPPVSFDLLIFEEAEQITEADFQQAARRARRFVLIGEPQDDVETARPVHSRPVRPNALRPSFFQRLWKNLRWDPRRLPYVWEHRDEQLHCRLRPVAPEQQRWVQSERLADRPDVELHILSRPRQEPELVEVVFPATTTVPEAKEYLFRELGEVTLQAAGGDWYWEETTERVVLRLTPAADPNAVLVPLCAGVRELVVLSAGDENDETAEWRTCAVEFDRAAGWNRAGAKNWAAEHLSLCDSGRSTLLTMTHRTRPVLAAWLRHLLHGDALPLPTQGAVDEPAFEFVAVPSLAPAGELSRRGNGEPRWQASKGAAVATRMRSVKGGAGLETDLADSRRIDQIPADLRAMLPARGIVNYLEAQALIRCLEELLADDSFRAAAERWQQSQARPCERDGEACAALPQTLGRSAHCPTIAVIALYPAQAELITRLLQRVPALLASPLTVEVGPPTAFRHRECFAALVSLTRSHTHRAVPFGDGPTALAFTRASERVIVFGDPGTLARRGLWQGPLDHLDETAAEHERALASRIIWAIQETEAIPPGFRLREGNLV